MKDEIKKQIEHYDIESVEITDKQIILNRKQPEFKAGDVVFIKCTDGLRMIGLLSDGDVGQNEKNKCTVLLGRDDVLWIDECFGLLKGDTIRHATESERQLLFDELRKQKGLKWNAETMKLEKIRWRAGVGGEYAFIYIKNGKAEIRIETDGMWEFDYDRHKSGDYFNPNDPTDMAEAQSICEKINALFTARL